MKRLCAKLGDLQPRLAGNCLVALVAAILLGGCANIVVSARTEQMKPEVPITIRQVVAASAMKEAIGTVTASGDKEFNPLVADWIRTYDILSSDFKHALQASLASAGLMATSRLSGRFNLRAELLSLEQSKGDFSGVHVTASVRYRLAAVGTDTAVWTRTITLPFTAKIGDAPIFVWDRYRQGMEGAARANIQRLIESLSAFDPPPQP